MNKFIILMIFLSNQFFPIRADIYAPQTNSDKHVTDAYDVYVKIANDPVVQEISTFINSSLNEYDFMATAVQTIEIMWNAYGNEMVRFGQTSQRQKQELLESVRYSCNKKTPINLKKDLMFPYFDLLQVINLWIINDIYAANGFEPEKANLDRVSKTFANYYLVAEKLLSCPDMNVLNFFGMLLIKRIDSFMHTFVKDLPYLIDWKLKLFHLGVVTYKSYEPLKNLLLASEIRTKDMFDAWYKEDVAKILSNKPKDPGWLELKTFNLFQELIHHLADKKESNQLIDQIYRDLMGSLHKGTSNQYEFFETNESILAQLKEQGPSVKKKARAHIKMALGGSFRKPESIEEAWELFKVVSDIIFDRQEMKNFMGIDTVETWVRIQTRAFLETFLEIVNDNRLQRIALAANLYQQQHPQTEIKSANQLVEAGILQPSELKSFGKSYELRVDANEKKVFWFNLNEDKSEHYFSYSM